MASFKGRQVNVREARRMVSDYVMTQHHCQQRTVAEDSVGLGAYNMDSHNCQRYVTKDGVVHNEGDVQVGVSPYRISYRSIRPKREECTNLLVPVCLAASHIAYESIRMEPVFMVLGQSAATAAAIALDEGVAVQIRHVPLDDPSVAILVMNSGVRHSLADGAYAARRAECAVALVEAARAGEIAAAVRHLYKDTAGIDAATFVTQAAGGPSVGRIA